jgi:uncharacterized phage protein (TIGR01671 family)
MNREIWFRAWDKKQKQMVYKFMTGNTADSENHFWTCPQTWDVNDWVNNDQLEIMQYTGLKDRNGAKIFEGDIIKARMYPFYGDADENKENPEELNYLALVGLDYDGAYYDLIRVSERVLGRACGSNLSDIHDCCEVVGSAYQNPELLQVAG